MELRSVTQRVQTRAHITSLVVFGLGDVSVRIRDGSWAPIAIVRGGGCKSSQTGGGGCTIGASKLVPIPIVSEKCFVTDGVGLLQQVARAVVLKAGCPTGGVRDYCLI